SHAVVPGCRFSSSIMFACTAPEKAKQAQAKRRRTKVRQKGDAVFSKGILVIHRVVWSIGLFLRPVVNWRNSSPKTVEEATGRGVLRRIQIGCRVPADTDFCQYNYSGLYCLSPKAPQNLASENASAVRGDFSATFGVVSRSYGAATT